jgi:hypothetical protein
MSARSMSDCELTDTYSPRRHRHCAGGKPGRPRDQYGARARIGGRDTDDQGGNRDDAFVGPQNGGTQPSRSVDEMDFLVGGLIGKGHRRFTAVLCSSPTGLTRRLVSHSWKDHYCFEAINGAGAEEYGKRLPPACSRMEPAMDRLEDA